MLVYCFYLVKAFTQRDVFFPCDYIPAIMWPQTFVSRAGLIIFNELSHHPNMVSSQLLHHYQCEVIGLTGTDRGWRSRW